MQRPARLTRLVIALIGLSFAGVTAAQELPELEVHQPVVPDELAGSVLLDDESWYPFAVKPPFGEDRGADKPFMVYAGPARIDARPGVLPPAIPPELSIGEPLGSRPAYYIVHFQDRIRSEWKQAVIDAGARSTENYLSNNALVFHILPAAFDRVLAAPGVDWVGYYEPAYKVDPLIGKLRVRTDMLDQPVTFLVALYGGAAPEPVQASLRAMGLEAPDDLAALRQEKHAPRGARPWILQVRGDRRQAPEIALLDDVQYVAEAATVKSYDAFSASGIMQSGNNAPWGSLGSVDPPGPCAGGCGPDATFFPLWARGLQGQHQMVGIADTGVDWGGTGELFGLPVDPLITTPTYDLKLPAASLRDGSSDPCDQGPNQGHGTGVAGSCCQDFLSNDTTEIREPDTPGRGEWGDAIAHEAQLVVGPINGYLTFDPTTQTLQWLDLADFGASNLPSAVHWCTGATFNYDFASQMVDTVIDVAEDMLVSNSAGNDAAACPAFDTNVDCQTQNWAKNAIDVGASDDLSRWNLMDTLSFDSARGPNWANPPGGAASDLVFPDVVSIGDDSLNGGTVTAFGNGTCGDGDSLLGFFGGTSGAAPTVAGAGALVHQYFEEGNQPGLSDASAALIKAVLINSTESLLGTGVCQGTASNVKRPGGDQGWGRPNLSSSLAFDGGSPTPFVMNAFDVRNADGFSASGQFDDIVINITNTGQPLKITLAWTDTPSSLGSGRPYLVNDLDLELIKGGTTYTGNNFDTTTGLSTTATSASDQANAVENIFLSASQVAALGSGAATVRVTMANAPTARNQGYALVVVGGLAPPTSVNFDAFEYKCGSVATITARDASPSATATVTSPSDSEVVNLSSIGGDFYEGIVSIELGDTTPNNGILGVADADDIGVVYETLYTDTATISCSPKVLTAGATLSGGCDAWDPQNPSVNTGEKYAPYMDSGELVTLGYAVLNDESVPLTNVTMELADGSASGCLSILSTNPVSVGTIPAGDVAGASWGVRVEPCGDLVPVTLEVTVAADGNPVDSVLADVSTLINADDVIVEQGVCFDHSSADMTSVPWTAYAPGGDISWTRSTSGMCDSEDRTDGFCADGGTGMYKQGTCNANNIAYESAGTLVPPAPISLVNSGAGPSGEPWRYGLKRFSLYGSTAVPESDEVFFGLYVDDDYASTTQITEGNAPYDQNNAGTGWPFSAAFFPGFVFFDCCGDTPTSWNWDAANGGTPDADPFCGVPGTPPDNQTVFCFGNTTIGAIESGPIGAPGEHLLNFAVMALDEGVFGLPDGGRCQVTGTACDSNTDCTGGPGNVCVDGDGYGVDNLELAWDEFYADDNVGTCAGGQCGQVSFDLAVYRDGCLSETATISVLDGNVSGSSISVDVASTGAGDLETISLTRVSGPLFVGQIELATQHGAAAQDGTLLVRPADTLTATYNDADDGTASPCVDVDAAVTDYPAGSVAITARNFYLDTGDDDGHPDTNEDVTFELTVENNTGAALQNTVVRIETTSPNIVCTVDDTANFGTIAAAATANNPDSERFRFQIDPDYECSDAGNPDTLVFSVFVTADEICGSSSPLSTSFVLDVDEVAPAVTIDAGPTPVLPAADEIASRTAALPRSLIRETRPSSVDRSGAKPATRSRISADHGSSQVAAASAPPADPLTVRAQTAQAGPEATCGNSQYDDGTAEDAAWFNGGQAGNPDCILGQVWDPADFGLFGDYLIESVCFDNSINFGGPWPNHWYIHPDVGGLPDDATILADGVVSTGDGAGEVEFNLGSPIAMGAAERFWVILRGDPGCCNAEDFNLELDLNTPSIQSFRNNCNGVAGLTIAATGEYVIHTTLAPDVTYACDTNDNSGLTPVCALPVSEAPGTQMLVGRSGALVDLLFENVGAFNYNVFVSTAPETLTLLPFDVDSPDGKLDCAVANTDLGATRSVAGYNLEAGIGTASDLFFILIGTDSGVQNGSLGTNSVEGERAATSYCVP